MLLPRFFIAYGVFYQGRNVTWFHRDSAGEPVDQPEYLVREVPLGDSYFDRYYAKPKNPGDVFNDLWPILEPHYWGGAYTPTFPRSFPPTHRSYEWNETAVKLWLCILSPYFALLFVRSIIWSVNTLRRP
jgi:hypothetical protein